jgi:hypothetical protein
MDAAAAAKAWADAAKQLRDKKQLEAACLTICSLAGKPSARTVVVQKAVRKLCLLRALAEATAAVLDERRRQRDWLAAGYALRVNGL